MKSRAKQTTTSQTAGYYWCDKCDEAAFGTECRRCSATARFIPTGTQVIIPIGARRAADHEDTTGMTTTDSRSRRAALRQAADEFFNLGRQIRSN